MEHIKFFLTLLTIFVSLQLSACTAKQTTAEKVQPARLETIEGTNLKRVVLTEKAAERINLRTAPVRDEQVNGVIRKVVPYAAVIYDVHGGTWLYTSPALLTFVRETITVDFIDGKRAILVNGPSSGTEVVTVGGAELFGAETGVSK